MSALLLGALTALVTAAAPSASSIRWVEDDWPAARAQAKREKKLVAVDVWATWCHTCLSMKNYVLTEPELAPLAKQHVWLSLDYDLEKNAKFFERHPVSVFPTFLVLDPKTDRVVARWAGSGSVEQMRTFFAHAAAGDDPLSQGERALAEDLLPEARKIFERALAAGIKDPAVRTRVLLGWIEALYQLDKTACATRGVDAIQQVDDTSQGADYASMVAYCAFELPEGPKRQEVLHRLAVHLAKVAANDAAPLAVDDRSAVWGTLAEIYDALGDKARADGAWQVRLTLLEAAAAAAKTPEARATFDYHRMEVYLHFGRHGDAIEMLQASEKAQPKDFNHPWRQAQVYRDKGDLEAGLAAIDRALANGYGGRKLRLYSTKIGLLVAAGRAKEAQAVVAEARRMIEGLSEAQVRPGWRAEFEAAAKSAGVGAK
ncbi:MAG: thioredoxin family protein [Myxococcales bacterium]|nr:thioredoxin family protein [Myxococcales bacterium]